MIRWTWLQRSGLFSGENWLNRISLLFLFLIAGMAVRGQPEWKLRLDRDGIEIFTRTPSASTIKEYRVSARFEHPLKDVFEFLADLEKRPDWVINCTGIDIIDTTVEGCIRYHVSYDIPWPMADRDLVVEAALALDEEAGKAHILTRHTGLEYPLEEGVIRMPGYREEVILEEEGPASTRFSSSGYADPGGTLPAWIVNMFLVDGIYDSMIRTRSGISAQRD